MAWRKTVLPAMSREPWELIPRLVWRGCHLHTEVWKGFTPLKYGSYLPGEKKMGCFAGLPIQKLTSHSFDSDKQLEGVTSAGSWHSELRFFIYGSLCFVYAFMCLGRLPRFKVAALKIAGNGCGVQVWSKWNWWYRVYVCVCTFSSPCACLCRCKSML